MKWTNIVGYQGYFVIQESNQYFSLMLLNTDHMQVMSF